MMGRILVVEDNTALAEGLAYNLRHEGHDVRIAEDGESGLADAREWEPDLVILDLMLPRLDGYGVLAAIREDRNDMPVIILSARGEEADKVRGSTGRRRVRDEAVRRARAARARAVAAPPRVAAQRRAGDRRAPLRRRRGRLAARTATRAGEPATLAPKEFDLLLVAPRRRARRRETGC